MEAAMKKSTGLIIMLCFITLGCQGLYNNALEKVFGFEKRELLQKAVESVKKDQVEAQKEFQDAMTELKNLYGFEGGQLEKMYNKFKDRYEDSKEQADVVHDRVKNMDRIAKSMFSEWNKEIKEFTNAEFARDSRSKLEATKERYELLYKSARTSEDAMEPILRKLNDHVLYLKHNLNAASLGALQGETKSIQADVEELMKRMEESIREANNFIPMLRK
jgi:two-component sensor histidine kinase